ncbi:MAG: alpha/beta hydrolase [Cyanobacteria bacterium J06598_1]
MNRIVNRYQTKGFRGWRVAFQIAIALTSLTLATPVTKPAHAAEKITVSLGATFERSISVEALEIYANEGRITDELAPYVSYITDIDPNALEAVRGLLTQRADVDVTTVSQFSYTPQGEYVLNEIGKIFRTGARLSGSKGLRGAAILAAADDANGLTILNVIKQFPTPVLRIDLQQGLAIANQATDSLQETRVALDLVEQLALQSITEAFPSGQSIAELNRLANQPGPFQAKRLTTIVKTSQAPVDVYLPQSPASISPMPTVIISHGFGNERKTYRYLAEFLASHGFAVINVEHPGSSTDQLTALISGRTSRVVPDDEFTRRPETISQVLTELENRAVQDKNFAQIDFNNVGIIGQSFGGYTALAVAGAPINLASLRANCPTLEFSLNVVVLLQCQAINLAPPNINELDFSDPRIKAVIAINPMTSLIFGPESMGDIEVPVMMMAGSSDTVAPALPEQVIPFTWLTTPERHLLVMDGGTHFSTMGITGEETFQLPPSIFGPVPEVAQNYTQVMSLGFLSTYLRNDLRYQPILTSNFTNRFSEPEMPLNIVDNLDADLLTQQLKLAAAGELPVMLTLEQAFNDMATQESQQGPQQEE